MNETKNEKLNNIINYFETELTEDEQKQVLQDRNTDSSSDTIKDILARISTDVYVDMNSFCEGLKPDTFTFNVNCQERGSVGFCRIRVKLLTGVDVKSKTFLHIYPVVSLRSNNVKKHVSSMLEYYKTNVLNIA